mgnify:CR=1 FL=1
MKIVKLYSILLFVSILASCTLERESYQEIYPEKFFQNESDIEKALTALYAPFSTDWGGLFAADQYSYTTCSEFTTDIMKCTWTGYEHFYEHWWKVDGTDNGTDFAERMYKQYNHLSRIKSTIHKIQESPVTDGVKSRTISEAKCLYGWMGFIMYDLFGPVPLATDEAINDPQKEILIPRLSDVEYCKIMEDYLLEAAQNLPEKQSEWGRVTQGMAKMLLLKFYMMNKDYSKAEDMARELKGMEGSTYELLTDGYDKLFSKEYVQNKEIIQAIPCGTGMPNYWLAEVMPSDYPYPHSISAWNGYKMDWTFFETFEPDDKRLNNIISSYTTKNGEEITKGIGALNLGAVPMKYGYDANMVGSIGTIDVIVYRYADVLLSLAECINENNNGPTPEAIDLVNRIRRRAGLNDLPNNSTANKQSFKDAILMERGHEFFCEGLRRQDLIRHDKFVSTSKELYPNSQSDWYKVRFPIPTYYINESNGQVKQNEGY